MKLTTRVTKWRSHCLIMLVWTNQMILLTCFVYFCCHLNPGPALSLQTPQTWKYLKPSACSSTSQLTRLGYRTVNIYLHLMLQFSGVDLGLTSNGSIDLELWKHSWLFTGVYLIMKAIFKRMTMNLFSFSSTWSYFMLLWLVLWEVLVFISLWLSQWPFALYN